jgi:hypothetical protein
VAKAEIDQRDINVELPRALFGGLKRRPTEELLRCVARDYAELELENRKLRRQIEELQSGPSKAAPPSAGEGVAGTRQPAVAAAPT